MNACMFCYRGALAYCRPDGYPVTAGHTLVIPGRHIETIFDATPAEHASIWALVLDLRQNLLINDPSITGFNVGFNAGSSAGQTVPHAHVHVIPRRDGDTPSPQGGVRGVIPARMSYQDRP